MGTVLLEANDLTVKYGFKTAVSGLSFTVAPGASVGLLGANGAGKTSTLHAVLGLLRPRRGQIRLFGGRVGRPSAFRRLGFAPDEGWPPDYLSGAEYLSFVGGFRVADRSERRRQVEDLLAWFELDPRKKIRAYSKGMKRRLVLAQAFLGHPELLILDEPLNGLDPLVIVKLRERIARYLQSGGSLLFSSHILAEVEKVCTEVIMLSQGKLLLQAGVPEIVARYGSVEKAFTEKAGGGP